MVFIEFILFGNKSQAVVADKTVYVSGCLGTSLETGKLVGDGAREQAEAALGHLKNVLRASGSTLNNVVKTTVYLQDFNDFASVNEIYKEGLHLCTHNHSNILTHIFRLLKIP